MTTAPNLNSTAGKLANLEVQLAEAAGAATARERIEYLLDEGSFVEIDALARHRSTAFGLDAQRPATDGVVTGYGTINGTRVCVFSQDRSIFDGRIGEVHGEKILKVIELATKTGVPLISILDGAGSRAAEGIITLDQQAKILAGFTQASGLIPLVTLVLGQNRGPLVYAAALADFLVETAESSLIAYNPELLAVTGVAPSAAPNAAKPHFVAKDCNDGLDWIMELVDFLPLNHRAEAVRTMDHTMEGGINANLDLDLDVLIPDAYTAPYDMRAAFSPILDDAEFFEVQASHAPSVITGFGHIEGRSVGIVATQPGHNSGHIDAAGATKAARFIRTCDAFNIPFVSFIDSPGFAPDGDNPVAAGAALAFAQAEASVGSISVITRKAVGDIYTIFGAKGLGTDLCFAWPTAQIAVDEAIPAATQAYAAEINKKVRKGADRDELTRELTEGYEEKYLTPYSAAEHGLVDAVIPPSQTRGHIVEGLRLLERKFVPSIPKKHGNLPF
ncbi:MAG: carboxyl transferase domain-containing protein [Corynebacterium sp.]|nr:carboxyl transferase domain-containing protein [Corynebacterium sp.]